MTTQPAWYVRTPFFYGWAIVGAAFLANLISTGVQLWSLSVLVVPMLDELADWSRADVFGAMTVRSWIATAGTLLLGRYMDRRYGGMALMVAGGVLGGLSAAMVAFAHEPVEFMLWFGVVGGIAGPGQAYIVSNAIVSKWFIRRRARALSLSTMGTGAAALVMPLAVTALIGASGWRDTWIVLGIATVAITVPLSLLMRRQPEDVGLLPDGDKGADAEGAAAYAAQERSFTARQALRTPSAWLMAGAMTMASISILGLPTNLVPMLTDRGISTEAAAGALTLYGAMSVAARFGWGWVAQRTHVRTAVMLLGAYATVVTSLFLLAGGLTPLLFVLAAGTGFAVGGIVVLNPLSWPTYFGRDHVGAIMAVVMPVTAIGGSTGPYIMAKAYDWTGDYAIGLAILAAAWAACALLMRFAKPPPRPALTPAPLSA